jgi:DNA-binding CsgD family transcriptional regulator
MMTDTKCHPPGPDPFHLVELIYDTVEVPSHWPRFMEAVCRATATTHGLLAVRVPGQEPLQITTLFGWTEAQLREYGERWAHVDPCWRVDAMPDGSAGRSSEVCPDEEFHASVAYREFYAPNNCHNGCGMVIKRSVYGMSFMSLCRSKDAGAYTEAEVSLLRTLAPHLQRAVRLHGELSSLRSQLAAVRNVMDLYPVGFLQTDADGRVIYANETAKGDENLTLESGQLRVRAPRGNQALREAIRNIAGEACGRLRHLDVDCLSGGTPYRLLLMPAPKSGDATAAANQPMVSILLVNLNSSPRPDPVMLSELFLLTPAEARFTSCLATGFSVEEIAAELNISRETARTHLRRILSKTHTRRQGELISLVLRSIPFPRG